MEGDRARREGGRRGAEPKKAQANPHTNPEHQPPKHDHVNVGVHSAGFQVILAKRCVYVKPVQRSDYLPMDKFRGVVISLSRFNGSLRDALYYSISCGFWPDANASGNA